MTNRNITLSLPAELVRRAKVSAAQQDTSVSALVASLLESEVGRVDNDADVWTREEALMKAGALRIGTVTWDRDALHER